MLYLVMMTIKKYLNMGVLVIIIKENMMSQKSSVFKSENKA